MRICHVINNLEVGGAEVMLHKLLAAIDRTEFDCRVISLIHRGTIGARIQALGVPVTELRMQRGIPSLSDLWRLRQAVQHAQADVVQTWMFHADLLGGLAAASLRPAPAIVWNIRHCQLEPHINKASTFWTARFCARLSRWIPRLVLVNSLAGLEYYADLGYERDRLTWIPNGFDLSRFRPSADARASVRVELGLSPDAVLVGHVARFHPEKDHANLIRAAELIADHRPAAEFVLCGDGVTLDNPELKSWVAATRHPQKFHLLGRRNDIPQLQASFDLGVSSSRTEAFPNVIGEAMASGVPCVVTDVGGSAEVVGETGRVVPPFDPAALATACLDLLNLPAREFDALRRRARERVERHFDITRIAAAYCDVWRSVVPQRDAAPLRRAA